MCVRACALSNILTTAKGTARELLFLSLSIRKRMENILGKNTVVVVLALDI